MSDAWIIPYALATLAGKSAFILVFALLLVGILRLPRHLQMLEPSSSPSKMDGVRWAAIGIILVQILVYLIWG